MRQTNRKTKIQLIGAFCYNCVYSVIAVGFCAMAFDTHVNRRGGGMDIVSHQNALWVGIGYTLFGGLLLFFLWRQWWRDSRFN